MNTWEYLRWLWRTRGCEHKGERRVISGAEYQEYGFRYRCMDCGKVLR